MNTLIKSMTILPALVTLLALAGCGGGDREAHLAEPATAAAATDTANVAANAPKETPQPPSVPETPETPGPTAERTDLPGDDPKEVARVFLETQDEAVRTALMTEKARRAHEENNFKWQRKPDQRFELGESRIDGDTAEVAMKGPGPTGRTESGNLKLRREGGAWRVYATTMNGTDEHPEMTMDFENPMAILGELGAALSEMRDAMKNFGEIDPEAEARIEAEKVSKVAARFEAVKAVDPAALRTSWTVDLALDGRPAGEAIAELAAPLGLKLDRSKAPADAIDAPVTLRAEGLTYLEAIEHVCRAVGLYATYGPTPGEETPTDFEGDAVTPVPGPRPWPVTFAGPFVIEVTGVDQQPTATGKLKLRILGLGLPAAVLSVLQEGSLAFSIISNLIKVESITGTGGQTLLVPQPVFSSTKTSGTTFFEHRLDLSMKGLLRNVTAIQSVEGQITIPTPTLIKEVRFDTLRLGSTQERDGIKLSMTGEEGQLPFQFKVEVEGKAQGTFEAVRPNGEGPESSEGTNYWWLARDAGGRPLGGGVEDLPFTGMGPTIRGDQPPTIFELKLVESEKRVPLTFRIEQVPLKDFGRMPAALEALDYSGHEAPVSAVFVEFLEGRPAIGNARPYKIRIANHSNKDVSRLVLDRTFLDAEGKPLGHTSPDNFDFEPYLVAKRDTKELKKSGFFVPQGAEKAVFRVREVGFTDATTWKAETR